MDIKTKRDYILRQLKQLLSGGNHLPIEAARYSALTNGHFWRPLICIGIAEAYNASLDKVLPVAAAEEMIHVASLMLDDLPSMDNADFRRGRDSCWKRYGISTTELATHALIGRSIVAVTRNKFLTDRQIKMIIDENAVTCDKMIAGQDMDNRQINLETLEDIVDELYHMKSGRLFGSSAYAGGVVGGANESELQELRNFGILLGTGYQLRDDFYDASGKHQELGKITGKDEGRRTALSILGREKTRSLLKSIDDKTTEKLKTIGRDFQSVIEVFDAIKKEYEKYLYVTPN